MPHQGICAQVQTTRFSWLDSSVASLHSITRRFRGGPSNEQSIARSQSSGGALEEKVSRYQAGSGACAKSFKRNRNCSQARRDPFTGWRLRTPASLTGRKIGAEKVSPHLATLHRAGVIRTSSRRGRVAVGTKRERQRRRRFPVNVSGCTYDSVTLAGKQ
jgi:hypothetical protein